MVLELVVDEVDNVDGDNGFLLASTVAVAAAGF